MITTHGVAILLERPAVRNECYAIKIDGRPSAYPNSVVPVRPAPGLYDALLFPGMWRESDVQAAYQLYHSWTQDTGAFVQQRIAEREAAIKRIAAAEAALAEVQGIADLLSATIAAIQAGTDLPAIPAGFDQEIGAALEVFAGIPVDILASEAETMEMLADWYETAAATAAQYAIAIEKDERTLSGNDKVIEGIGFPPEPFIRCNHDGVHITDVPECYTIGADRSERSHACDN